MTKQLEKDRVSIIISSYLQEIRQALGKDYVEAVVYGSFARDEYTKESDIDIAIFTERKPEEFYLLVNQIAEITFEYNVEYDVILSPVFQNVSLFDRMLKAVPYYQSIKREGISFG